MPKIKCPKCGMERSVTAIDLKHNKVPKCKCNEPFFKSSTSDVGDVESTKATQVSKVTTDQESGKGFKDDRFVTKKKTASEAD